MRRNKRIPAFICTIFMSVAALAFVYPIIFTVTNSFMSAAEIERLYLGREEGFMRIRLIPYFATLKQYITVLINNTAYLYMYWNSFKNVAIITAGQAAVSAMAGFAFAAGRFRGRNVILFTYIVAALLPFQVTLVPNFIMLNTLGLLDTNLALILPAVFAPFGVFLLSQQMRYIPVSIMEAASIDGASLLRVFTSVYLPLSKPSVAGLCVLCFVDNWNMIEQPMVFIRDIYKMPLSLYLFLIKNADASFVSAASVIFMALPLFVFLYAGEYLAGGIELTAVK